MSPLEAAELDQVRPSWDGLTHGDRSTDEVRFPGRGETQESQELPEEASWDRMMETEEGEGVLQEIQKVFGLGFGGGAMDAATQERGETHEGISDTPLTDWSSRGSRGWG